MMDSGGMAEGRAMACRAIISTWSRLRACADSPASCGIRMVHQRPARSHSAVNFVVSIMPLYQRVIEAATRFPPGAMIRHKSTRQ